LFCWTEISIARLIYLRGKVGLLFSCKPGGVGSIPAGWTGPAEKEGATVLGDDQLTVNYRLPYTFGLSWLVRAMRCFLSDIEVVIAWNKIMNSVFFHYWAKQIHNDSVGRLRLDCPIL
jgi:hypothetical protein